MTHPATLVAIALAAATATVGCAIASYPAHGQSDQWAILAQQQADKKPAARPRFYIRRKAKPTRAPARAFNSTELRRFGHASGSARRGASGRPSLPKAHRDSFDEAFAAFAALPTVTAVRTVRIAPPYAGAFELRTPPEQPRAPASPPFQDTPLGKAVIVALCVGAVAGAAFTTELRQFFTATQGANHA